MSLVECVPNFSDGRDASVLVALTEAVLAVKDATVLDASQDPDHHRAVLTFAAAGGAALEAGLALVRVATERIDLRRHAGAHPRMGATDVFPIVPLGDSTLEDCVLLARALGERIGEELGIPVFLYGAAATRPGRKRLPDVRRGGFEFLRVRIGSDPDFEPDAGPARIHPSAGATAVGVREFLIAFNVLLETNEVEPARRIARRLRESDGGLQGVRALGLYLDSLDRAQVSMNLTDYRRTGLVRAFEEVERLAREEGVRVAGSELIGLAPAAALDASVARRVRLRNFSAEHSIVERRLKALTRRTE